MISAATVNVLCCSIFNSLLHFVNVVISPLRISRTAALFKYVKKYKIFLALNKLKKNVYKYDVKKAKTQVKSTNLFEGTKVLSITILNSLTTDPTSSGIKPRCVAPAELKFMSGSQCAVTSPGGVSRTSRYNLSSKI